MLKWSHLRVQFAAYFLLSSLLIIVLMGSILFYSISPIFMAMTLEHTVEGVEQRGVTLATYIEKLKAVSNGIVNNSTTMAFIESDHPQVREKNLALIQTYLETDANIKAITLVSKDGRILSNVPGLDMKTSENMMAESWYKAACSSDQMPILTSIRRSTVPATNGGIPMAENQTDWVISISQEIKGKTNENHGVLLIDVAYQVIEEQLSTLDLGQKGYAFVINEENQVVYHPDSQYYSDPLLGKKLIQISQMKQGYDEKMGMMIHHYHIPKTNWTLVGISSMDALLAVKRHILETLGLVSILLSIVVIGSGVFVANRLTNPIKALEVAMTQVENGLSQLKVDEKGCFEAKSLAKHFNKMTTEIQRLMDNITEKETYLRQSELSALQSQINPHFLYNTLDTIVWMAEFNDSEKVIAVTKSLANFFRLSLSQGHDLISLEDEIAHVSEYLFIQKQRYSEQLSYEIGIDLGAVKMSQIKVPKIILQPIVENAIYHGIREASYPGKIIIRGWIDSETNTLYIEVADNGIGFETAQFKTIKQEALVDENKLKLGGIGLDNVEKRLQLYYGEGYGIDIKSQPGESSPTSTPDQGTRVTLRLPVSVPMPMLIGVSAPE